ncbi:hypothetical protein QVD17_31950 [Tagetes erecta]|uniref:Uncharacterized protein n=1 Tax=Tagetes erecta TaxID=13708 RepID=A0AAD8NP97_TARER|nr:hypothetical protein QVD17_31950 [Tagetes erecta]
MIIDQQLNNHIHTLHFISIILFFSHSFINNLQIRVTIKSATIRSSSLESHLYSITISLLLRLFYQL